jgi:TolB-like protein
VAALLVAAAAAVGRALKTDYVLAGSVGEYGFVDGFGETATVGFNVRLVHSAEADVVWAGSLSRRVSTVAFSQESAHRLAHQVLQDLLGQMIRDLTRHPPAHAEAGK